MLQIRQIAVLIETSREYGRGLLRGVTQFHREKPNWSVYFQQQDLGAPLPRWMKTWQGDGILARVTNQKTGKALLETGIPLIDLRGGTHELGVPFFGIDNQHVAHQAFDHLVSCGLQNFAFVGEPSGKHIYDDKRRKTFAKLTRDKGGECHVFTERIGSYSTKSWESHQNILANWLTQLPKPIGVMCCHDDRGQQVLDACRRAELGVPEEVAVIGVDNDEFLCRLSIPPLTSIDVHAERIGYEAAALLDRIMNGEAEFNESVFFESAGVVSRHSTDIIACSDPEIARALRFIRQNACNFLTVNDVLRQVHLSRSLLNRRFKEEIGHTPKKEIHRVQMKTAMRLLLNSSDPIHSIAEQCGFNEAWYFISVFRKHTGVTPGAFRKRRGKREESPAL